MSLTNPPGNVADLLAAAREAASHINRVREEMKRVSAEIAAAPKPSTVEEVSKP